VTLRALGTPREVEVASDAAGTPVAVTLAGRRRRVAAVRDDWLVQDLWWTGRPVDRHYFELVLDPGRHIVAYRETAGGAWFAYG
jgi:hypothetical protein